MNGDARQDREHATQILDSLGTAVLVFDPQLRLSYINQAGEMMFARSASHACGKTAYELIANADMLQEQLAGAITSEQVIAQHGCQLQLPDAPALRVNCTITPLTGTEGVSGVLLELRQIDHRLRIEQEEFLITQQRASHALVRGLAHEIKNPLGGLRGAAQLLEREIDDQDLKEYTQIIIREADRLQVLMDRMLGPNNLPKMQPVNIHEILQRVCHLVEIEAGSGLQVKQDYDPSLPELQADPDQLVQAILNVVRNASQALEGTGNITLRTRVLRHFNIGVRKYRLVARIEIIDDGPGIDAAFSKQIFYPMITGRSEGTGLGLSISQSLISRLGGLIDCDSQPGETVFTILLPLDGKV